MSFINSLVNFMTPQNEVIVRPQKSEFEMLVEAYKNANGLYLEAQSHFEHAEYDFINSASLELAAREAQLNIIIKKMKEHTLETGCRFNHLMKVEQYN